MRRFYLRPKGPCSVVTRERERERRGGVGGGETVGLGRRPRTDSALGMIRCEGGRGERERTREREVIRNVLAQWRMVSRGDRALQRHVYRYRHVYTGIWCDKRSARTLPRALMIESLQMPKKKISASPFVYFPEKVGIWCCRA
jgi:hypothetical protein